jgi:methylated-DNA-[protein]-cysteine S-methyltransferase
MLKKNLYSKLIDSPVGKLTLLATDKGISLIEFENSRRKFTQSDGQLEDGTHYSLLMKCEKQLGEYFAGKRKQFDLPLDIHGTIFQIKAWKELQKIPYGQTISYGEQARRVGDVKKARAVGMANGRNPISIIVPCHRVIGTSGALVGFGGGLDTKKHLLELEQRLVA